MVKSIGRISGTLGLMVLLTCLAPRLARAAEVTEEDANALALAGHYQEALEAYSTLYSRTWEPTYLHNVARCYQKLGRPDEAIDYFNRYLRLAKDLDESVKEEVRGYIREMEALRRDRDARAAQSKGAATSPIIGAADRPGTAGTNPAPPLSAGPPTIVSAAPESPPWRSKRIAAYVVGGASLVAIGIGGGFGVRAILKNQDADRGCPPVGCSSAGISADSDARTSARISDVAFGLGIVGAGAATYLYLISREKPADASTAIGRQFQIEPQLGSNQAGLLVGANW